MEKKQTAIDWLLEEVKRLNDENYDLDFGIPEKIVEQAKAMEKEQIIKAHGNKKVKSAGVSNCMEILTGERYYNETYMTEDLSDWDVTLNDGLEDEPPFISDDFQIGPDGAYEHTEEFENKLKSKKKK